MHFNHVLFISKKIIQNIVTQLCTSKWYAKSFHGLMGSIGFNMYTRQGIDNNMA
jgi:hypothetical protein